MYVRLETIQQLQAADVLVDPDLNDEQGQTAMGYFQQRVSNPDFKLKGDQAERLN
ncbi:hypothetical protein S40293_11375 [Stachybotrys chartarum IBT 40293]|nr:hypothetical protein S40293_11375 [Stachybotrys chartarum IBT 40293]